jgi:hypothetical protein
MRIAYQNFCFQTIRVSATNPTPTFNKSRAVRFSLKTSYQSLAKELLGDASRSGKEGLRRQYSQFLIVYKSRITFKILVNIGSDN